MKHTLHYLSGCLLLISTGAIIAQEEPVFEGRRAFAEHPRENKFVPLSSLQMDKELGKELKIEVWATSPLVYSPVAMDTDAQGRLWLTEGIEYTTFPVQQRITAGQSIVVLTDTDADGKADKSHVFVTEKTLRHSPLGIAVFDNKIVLSATPSIIIYTDVNRNAVFEPGIDKREVFLTGFLGGGHDHSLHAVVGSPSGQWYFSYGNCAADVRTRDQRHFLTGSFYGNSEAIGKKSSDGHLYIGGMAMRINPDGTGLSMVGHNMRNPHDMAVNSFGDIFQSDNDEPPHCRSTWLMEYGNLGYADLYDGSREWRETAKSWDEVGPMKDKRGRRFSKSHWGENYPGTLPPGTVYGSGSPVGTDFYESDALGPGMRGTFLSCDMVRKELMIYQPKLKDAQIEMGPNRALVGLKPDKREELFLPTDVVIGTDGSLFLSDFYNKGNSRTRDLSGTIYRISRKDEKRVRIPKVDYASTSGLVKALKNPARNVRAAAVPLLVAKGDSIVAELGQMFNTETNPYVQARAIWVLAQVGPKGQNVVRELLQSERVQWRITAYRALRHAEPEALLEYAKVMATDKNASVRREVALSLRDIPYSQCKDFLLPLIDAYDGNNRWYLEALGTAATGKEAIVYSKLIRPKSREKEYSQWGDREKNLAWRMFSSEAIEDLDQVIRAQKPGITEFRHLLMAFTRFSNDEQRLDRQKRMESLGKVTDFAAEEYQMTIDEINRKDMEYAKGELLSASYLMPKTFGNKTQVSDVNTIVALKGDSVRGKTRLQACFSCHRIEGQGVEYGPNLTGWGKVRTIKEIVEEIVHPAKQLARGYEYPVRISTNGHVAEGMLSNYKKYDFGSEHGGSLNIKVFGGRLLKIFFSRKEEKIEMLKNHSWMPEPSQLGLNDQDVRDIAEYLKKL